MAGGGSIQECSSLSELKGGCEDRRLAYFLCKRGQLDMRKRMKGNMPKNGITHRTLPENAATSENPDMSETGKARDTE